MVEGILLWERLYAQRNCIMGETVLYSRKSCMIGDTLQ